MRMRVIRQFLGRGLVVGVIAATASPRLGLAQSAIDAYPSKPVTIISPFGTGGSVEIEIRMYLQHILESTGKIFLFDAKIGGGGTVGMAYVAKAAPDGYTVVAASSSITIAPSFYPNLAYDNVRDFSPISLLSKKVYVMIVNPSSPYRNLAEYLAYAKAHPGELNFGTAGRGGATHLPGEMLHYLTNTRVTFVHYKTPPQRLQDLMADRVHAAVGTFTLVNGLIKAGKLRAIAVTTRERDPLAPDVPTMEEQGVPGYDISSWTGLSAPARTPPAIVGKLNAMFAGAVRNPDVARKLVADGAIMVGSSPEQFRQVIATETERWRKLITAAGIKPEE